MSGCLHVTSACSYIPCASAHCEEPLSSCGHGSRVAAEVMTGRRGGAVRCCGCCDGAAWSVPQVVAGMERVVMYVVQGGEMV
jgi:hypothetical protein